MPRYHYTTRQVTLHAWVEADSPVECVERLQQVANSLNLQSTGVRSDVDAAFLALEGDDGIGFQLEDSE